MTPRVIIALVLALLLLGGGAWMEGRVATAKAATAQAQRERDTALAEKATAEQRADDATTSATVVTEYIDRVQVVYKTGATITREVPVYVTPHADAACVVPAGFVRLHNAAAQGDPPGAPAGDPDAPAPGVSLSAVADVVTDNYTSCRATGEQLIALQAWADQVSEPAAPAP